MSTKIVHIEPVGEVVFTRRKGSKRISLRVKHDGTVTVNYPWNASNTEVINFVLKSKSWITKQQEKQRQTQIRFKLHETFTTKLHDISIIPLKSGVLRAVLKNSKVVITIPDSMSVEDDAIQQFIRKVIVEVCRKEAKMYLPERVSQLADIHGLQYEKVFVKNLKSKWGSCSSMKNINLNLHLMLLPDYLIDYIILHELAHTVELNHSAAFWELLDELTQGHARSLDKEMKTFGHFIFK